MSRSSWPGARFRAAFAAACAAVTIAAPANAAEAPMSAQQAADHCAPALPGEQCGPGNGRRTPGGRDKVPHRGWPAVTGILWKVVDTGDHGKLGGVANDELLGHHGNDLLIGGAGADILWGDWNPKDNTRHQRDVLRGGPGDDWIYPSHGRSRVHAGPGRDRIWAYHGRGYIDCGGGRDVVRLRVRHRFRLRGCEVVKRFCAFGPDGRGGCRKPTRAHRPR